MSDPGTDKPRVGWLAEGLDAEEHAAVMSALDGRAEVVEVDARPAAVATAGVVAFLVHVEALAPSALQVVRDGDIPALFVVPPSSARSWHRVLRKGVHDVSWAPASADEIRVRLMGLLARRSAWNDVTSALCREIAHDLRSPLQALHFTVAALQNDDAVSAEFQEDVDALLEATDVAGLMLDGVSNLGRHAPLPNDDTPVLDLNEAVRSMAARRGFGGTVTVESGEPLGVRVPKAALKSMVADLLRVTWIRAAGRRRVTVQCLRFGDEGVVTTQARAYDALLENLPALLWRERPVMLRRKRVPMPLAGLAYAREVARAAGGDLVVRRDGQDLQVELRLPLA